MSTIRGMLPTSFKGADGSTVTGTTIFVSDPIDPKRGQGESAERFFLSAAKLANLGFSPAVGQEITIFYNRYGKVATIKINDDFTID